MSRPTSIPFSSTGQIPILTPPSSSGSNQTFNHLTSPNKFVHPARRRGSADSYLSASDDGHDGFVHPARSPSYSYSLTSNTRQNRFSNSPQLGSSPGACLIIRSSSTGSPRQSPRLPYTPIDTSRRSSKELPGELEFDVEPLSPYSYVPRLPNPPTRKNSRDAYSHISPPLPPPPHPQAKHHHQPPSLPPQKEEPDEGSDGETTIQLHMMPKSMLLPLPDRNAEMKHLLTHNSSLAGQIRRRLGEERYAQAFDLWTRTRRSEISDHEWLRRSKWFLQGDERLWKEWTMMVGWDHSVDLSKDEKGEKRGVEEYAAKMGHMTCLEEEEE